MQKNVTGTNKTATQGHISDIEEQVNLLRIEIKLGLMRRATKRLNALTARLTEPSGTTTPGSNQTIIAIKSHPQSKGPADRIP